MDPRAVLRRHFGYPDFRPGQEDLVRAVIAGKDAMGILPTGGGKSVCYQVPAHLLPGLTLVVSPLISLMADQVARAQAAGLEAALLNSTQTGAERLRVLAAARQGTLRLLLVATERLETASFLEVLRGIRVSLVAVDEAHCIASGLSIAGERLRGWSCHISRHGGPRFGTSGPVDALPREPGRHFVGEVT